MELGQLVATAEATGGAAESRGVHGWVNASSGNVGYAVYGNVGGGSTNLYAGYFDGKVTVIGTFSNPSDEKLKEGVATLDGSSMLEKLMQLRPTTYTYKKENFPSMKLPSGVQYGFIAQEMEAVFPEFVEENVHPVELAEDGEIITASVSYKAISYTEIIPLLLSAIQEQQAEIDALKSALQSNGIEVNR